RPIMTENPGSAEVSLAAQASLEAVGDTALGEVVRRHFDEHLVAGENADAVLAHAAGGMGDDLMIVLELDAKHRVRQQLGYHARKFKQFFFRHLNSRLGRKSRGT